MCFRSEMVKSEVKKAGLRKIWSSSVKKTNSLKGQIFIYSTIVSLVWVKPIFLDGACFF